jgi:hypothetical protein
MLSHSRHDFAGSGLFPRGASGQCIVKHKMKTTLVEVGEERFRDSKRCRNCSSIPAESAGREHVDEGDGPF